MHMYVDSREYRDNRVECLPNCSLCHMVVISVAETLAEASLTSLRVVRVLSTGVGKKEYAPTPSLALQTIVLLLKHLPSL